VVEVPDLVDRLGDLPAACYGLWQIISFSLQPSWEQRWQARSPRAAGDPKALQLLLGSRNCHAAVTASLHSGSMLSAHRHSDQGKAGVLILRVWFEDSRASPQLRIRMISRADLDQNAQDSKSASTTEEALAYVRDWLDAFTGSAR
jgi:hypothetical protein